MNRPYERAPLQMALGEVKKPASGNPDLATRIEQSVTNNQQRETSNEVNDHENSGHLLV